MGRSNTDSMDINDVINKLTKEKRRYFMNKLEDRLYDREWCEQFAGGYVDPNVELAKVNLYEELIELGLIPGQSSVFIPR